VVKKIRSLIGQTMPIRRIGTIDETDGATICLASGIKLHDQRRDCYWISLPFSIMIMKKPV
jgi:hypothetical protein